MTAETDLESLHLRAKVAREALIGATENDPDRDVARRARWVAEHASPVTLAMLGRSLR